MLIAYNILSVIRLLLLLLLLLLLWWWEYVWH